MISISPENQKKIISLISDMCMTIGINVAHDYDGIESDDDIILYLKAIHRQLPQKGIGDKYIVQKKIT